MTPDNWEKFDELTLEVAEDLFGETDAESADEVFGEDQYALLEEEYFYSENSHLLGHPYFTQADIRERGWRYDTLLFQLDSECCEEQDIVMWGDSGVGNFFINCEDLKRLDSATWCTTGTAAKTSLSSHSIGSLNEGLPSIRKKEAASTPKMESMPLVVVAYRCRCV